MLEKGQKLFNGHRPSVVFGLSVIVLNDLFFNSCPQV